jgi:outer membrane receptor protein involved in Fe transport
MRQDRLRVRTRAPMLLTTAIGAALFAGGALAQGGQAQAGPQSDQNALEEVVVTATRQTDTVNRVPLSVTAQTQRSLDQQGIRTISDLQATVPALQVTQQLGSGVGNFSIRGIVQSDAGAATTGFYLDDTPLQKRNVAGGVATGNGTPVPPLFDLDRVEVLRGPQGTLYGGSSEGGTIRYIQPAPSLTRYSTYVRAQASTPKKGDNSYEGGVAIGGPIIRDKLGFRVSAFARRQGGFIDMIDPVSNTEWAHNTGENHVYVFRGALTWAPTDRLRVTGAYLSSRDLTDNNNTSYTLPLPNGIQVQATCYNTATYNAASPPAGFAPNPVAYGAAACNAAKAANPAVYIRPGRSYGPFNLERYDSLAQDTSPSKTNLQVASLTFDYDFDKMSMKAVTSYIDDQNKTVSPENSQLFFSAISPLPFTPERATASLQMVADPLTGQQRVLTFGPGFNAAFGSVPARGQTGHFVTNNRRYGLTQEIRFQSAGDAKPLSWVAGVFYSNIRNPQRYDNYYNLDVVGNVLFGYPLGQNGVRQRYGVSAIETAPGLFNNFDARRQKMKDVEIAAFAEANLWIIPDKLRLTGGLRISRVTFDYSNVFIGPVTSVGADNPNPALRQPNPQNGGANAGSVSESPVTPKVSLQYNLTDNDLIYLTAAKGFRAGGINPLPSIGICGFALSQYGLQPTDLPQTYDSDTVWSYEAGAKVRLLNNRVQLNGAVYRIDWSNPQVTLSPGFNCGLVSTYNAGGARSQGFEIEGQARLFAGLSLNGGFGYNSSKYTATTIGVVGTTGASLVVSTEGQKQPLAPYTISLGARYDLQLSSSTRGYLRADWRYAAAFDQTVPTSPQYAPDQNRVPSIQNTNLRLGVEYGDFDINLFVNNLFDRKDGSLSGGRSGCADGTAACNTYFVYNPIYQLNTGYPREIGMQIAFRH